MFKKPAKQIKSKEENMEYSTYYEHITQNIHEILLDSQNRRYCVLHGEEKNSYYIKSSEDVTNDEKASNRLVLRDFLSDFNNHLVSNKPFKILFQNNQSLYNHFFLELQPKLYKYHNGEEGVYSDDDFDPFESPSFSSKPSIEEFTKVMKCLEPLIFSIKPIAKNLSDTNYAPTLMNLHNADAFKDKNIKEIKDIIESDMLVLSSNFLSDSRIEIKNGFNNYIGNKQYLFKQINDKQFEKATWACVRRALVSEYWNEIAEKLPNLKNQSEDTGSLLILSNKPIYCIDIDVDAILDISLTILNHHELTKVMNKLSESVILHKPASIDSIQFNSNDGKMNIVTAGEHLNQDLANQIAHLFVKMIKEYNSSNVIKEIKYTDEVEEKNKKYLDKLAETLWLDIELGNSSINSNKKKLKL